MLFPFGGVDIRMVLDIGLLLTERRRNGLGAEHRLGERVVVIGCERVVLARVLCRRVGLARVRAGLGWVRAGLGWVSRWQAAAGSGL